jgi:hypothetical protein
VTVSPPAGPRAARQRRALAEIARRRPGTARDIAVTWGRELMLKPPGQRVESSLRIAARFGAGNATAVRAREHLTSAGIICRDDETRRYYTPPADPRA